MKAKVKKALSFDFVRFGIVGVLNTLIDFAILNALFIGLDFSRIPANIISTTIAMSFSYLVNRSMVFGGDNNHRRQIIWFLTITLFGLYVIQTAIILLFTKVWHWPTDVVADLFPTINRDIVATNVAKVFATGATLLWNYFGYKHIVFRK
jgi:putative flippase GtrA